MLSWTKPLNMALVLRSGFTKALINSKTGCEIRTVWGARLLNTSGESYDLRLSTPAEAKYSENKYVFPVLSSQLNEISVHFNPWKTNSPKV